MHIFLVLLIHAQMLLDIFQGRVISTCDFLYDCFGNVLNELLNSLEATRIVIHVVALTKELCVCDG